MRIGLWKRHFVGSVTITAVACALAGSAGCNQEVEKSEVSTTPMAERDGEAPSEFPETLDSETCCERYCAAIADAGCAIADCVATNCPVPDGLSDFDARHCKQARADVLCCAWQYVPQTGCGVGDARQAPECADVVSTADEVCAAP